MCALGDTTYTHFCRCGKLVDAALAAAGASALLPRVDVDKEDWSKVDAWISGLPAGLNSLAGLKSFADLGGVPAAAAAGGADAAAAAAAAAGKKFSKSRPCYARVVAVEGLCVLSGPDDKDTVRLELQLQPQDVAAGGLEYLPGDALGIWTTNPPQVSGQRQCRVHCCIGALPGRAYFACAGASTFWVRCCCERLQCMRGASCLHMSTMCS